MNTYILKGISLIILLTAIIFITAGKSFSQVNCDTTISVPSKSNYILPYPAGKTYCITQGNCPTVGGHSNQFAYDFNTQIGDTITASRPGTVVFINEQYSDSDWVSGHENNVFIQHSDGSRIRYTHLKQNGVLVSAGSFVQAGQPLALSGNSGNTGGFPHLHIAVFRDGTSYNGSNSSPFNFSNTTGPHNSQNLCIAGGCYTALDPQVSVNTVSEVTPGNFELMQNYPNPFNPSTSIRFNIPNLSIVRIKVFDILGNEKAVLINRELKPGSYEIRWNANGFPGGIYYYTLGAGNFSQTRKLVLLK